MKTLELTTWERFELLRCIPRDAPLVEIPVLLRLVDMLELSDEEKESVGFYMESVMTPQGLGVRPRWDDAEAEREFTLEFETGDFDRLKALVSARGEWPTVEGSLVLKKKVEEAEDLPLSAGQAGAPARACLPHRQAPAGGQAGAAATKGRKKRK